MSSDYSEVFTKDNLNRYLNELSKEYKRLGGRNTPVDIVLIGGAAVIENYGFRDMTTDIDAIIPAASIMKDAIQHVGARFDLPDGWLNADFIMTASYSPHLYEHSVYYRTFNQVLYVRMVTGEYLIAMKLRAGRQYKNDLSDVVGILAEHEQRGAPISFELIDHAVIDLYGGWDSFPQHSVTFIREILDVKNYLEIYNQIRKSEQDAHTMLRKFEEAHPGDIKEENIDMILGNEAEQGSKQTVLAQLTELKKLQNDRDHRSSSRNKRSREDR